MAEAITIDVFLRAKNKTQDGVKQAAKALQEVKKEADGAAEAVGEVGESSKKAKTGLDNVEKSSRKAKKGLDDIEKSGKETRRILKELEKERIMILMEAKDRLTPLIDRAGTGLKGLTRKSWNITMKVADFATAPIRGIYNLLKNPIVQAGAVLGVSVGVKDTLDTYEEFEAAMSQVKAISGAEGDDFQLLIEKAKEMGATTKYTAQESAEAFNYMAMAGWDTKDMLDGIEGILSLAAASGEDLGTTSDIVTDVLTAMGYTAADAGHFADVLAQAAANANTNVGLMGETFKYVGTMAGTLGYRIEDVSLATGLMANSGLKGSMAGTSLNSILTRLATDTDGAASAVKKLGVEFFEQDGAARGLKSVMDELRRATRDMNDEEKAGLAKKVAGLEAQKGLLAIVNATEEDYNNLADAIENAKGAAGRMSDTMLDNLKGAKTLLQSAIDGVKIAFGERLKPYVKGIAVWLTEMMPDIEKGLSRFMDAADRRIDSLQGKIKGFTTTKAWADSDFFGKAHIAWNELIGNPLGEWWESDGRQTAADMARDVGGFIGTGLNRGIMALLGADSDGLLNDGMSAGASFANGFLKGFEPGKVKAAVMDAIKGIFSDSYFGGGNSSTSMLSTMLVGAVGLKGLGAGVQIGKGIYDMYSATKILGGLFKPTMGVPEIPMVGAPGTSAAAMGGLSMPVLASVAGGILGAMGLGASIKDLKRAQNAGLTWDRDRYRRQGLTKGGLVAGGAVAGAAIGSIIPGAGTLVGGLIGGGIGGLTALMGGNSISELFKSERERAHESLLQMGDDLKVAIENYNDTAARTDIARGLIDEYQELRDFMNSSDFDQTKAEEVQNRMKDILGDLQDMFPGLISGYEKLNGLSDERIAGLDREIDKMDEQEQRHLKQTIMDTKGQIPQMMDDYREVMGSIEEKQREWENTILYREGLESINQRYNEALEDDASNERLNALLKQAETLSEQRGFGTSFRGNSHNLLFDIGDSEALSKKQLSEMDDLIQQRDAMAEQLQTYYDSSVKLIEQDTGINLEEEQKKLDDLREAYNFTESHHGAMSEELRLMVEDYLPGFSAAEGAAEKMDALARGIEDTKEEMQPALQQIKELNDILGDLPEEKKIRIDVMLGGGLYLPSLFGKSPGRGLDKPSEHARGGLVKSAELSWIGEDGPEVVIPLSGKYRRRGLDLFEQAGRYMGIGYNAEGGIYDAAPLSAIDAPVSGGISASSSGQGIVIQVTARPETQVHISPSSSLEEIMETIRRSWSGMTDQMLNEIAQKIMLSYENMPGGAT